MTTREVRRGGFSSLDKSRDAGVAQLFLHCYMSQPNVRSLVNIARGWQKYPERALALALAGDIVCVKDPIDREYLEFLAGLGPVPAYGDILVTDPSAIHGEETPLSQQLESDRSLLSRLDRMLAGQGTICLNCYMFTEAESRLARLLESVLGRKVLRAGGNAALVGKASQKHVARAMAQDIGIPVSPGETVMLPLRADGRPRDLVQMESAIRAWLPLTNRVIIRGTLGASGSSTFVVDSSVESRKRALAEVGERADNSVYLVEAMLPTTASPNIGMFISPADGRISCASVTDQILKDDVAYSGSVFPSRAENLDAMIDAAHALAGRLRDGGMTGHVGFDFCECASAPGGSPKFFLAEINPRINGATYATAIAQKLNAGLMRAGVRPVGAFATMFVGTEARTFGELRRLRGKDFFDAVKGVGIVPFNTGCLAYGRCVLAVLGESRDQVRALCRAVGK